MFQSLSTRVVLVNLAWALAVGLGLPPATAVEPSADKVEPVLTLKGHANAVQRVAFSPDGKQLASADADTEARLWDAEAGKELFKLDGWGGLAFYPRGTRLATGGRDGNIVLWDTGNGEEILTIKKDANFAAMGDSIAYTPDSKVLATVYRLPAKDEILSGVRLWEARSAAPLALFRPERKAYRGLAFSPDGKYYAVGTEDKNAELFTTAFGDPVARLVGHTRAVVGVAFSPDGKTLATASADKRVKVWDLATLEEAYTLAGHQDEVTAVAYSPDGKYLASASKDETVKLWDLAAGKEVTSLRAHDKGVNSVAFSPDGKRLASAGEDKTIKVWDATKLLPAKEDK